MKRVDIAPLLPAQSCNADPWQAWLALGFVNDGGTTRLIERSHHGPLRVQKPLYPEGGAVCHAIVVHPPGGIVGGDKLDIHACVGKSASAFITTPGAAKWYKSGGLVSQQNVHLNIGDNASLEWLPQETIFFNDAQVRLDNTIEMGKDASFIGCDILCFGRTASGESFASGRVTQRTAIRRDGRLVWFEQGDLAAGSDAMTSPLGLAGNTVCATLISVGKPVASSALAAIREENAPRLSGSEAFGVTQMKSVVVARYLGNSSETARRLMIGVWRTLRPMLTGRDPVTPRIWNT